MSQYHSKPETYEAMVAREVPAYHRLQEQVSAATIGRGAARILDLGTGSGVTARSVLRHHPRAQLVGIDESVEMLAATRHILPPETELIVPRDRGDVVTPVDVVYDTPSTAADQLVWMQAAGLVATTAWLERDLAVLVGDLKGTR